MPELKFAVLFQAVDQLSDKLGAIGESVSRLAERVSEGGNRLYEMGERMVGFGEKLSLVSALASEGANQLHEWSEALSEPAMGMEQSMATMAAMTGLASDKLAEIKEHAIAFTGTHPGATAEQWVDGFTRLRNVYQDTAQAMRAEDVAAMLNRFGVDTDAATRLFAVAQTNFGASAQTTADQLMRTVQLYGVSGQDVSRFAMALGRLGGLAQGTNTSLAELMSLTGEANKAFGGGRGMTSFVSILNELVSSGKTAGVVDWSHGMAAGLQQLRAEIDRYSSGEEKIAALKELGAGTNAPQLLALLNGLDEVQGKTAAVGAAAGTINEAYGTATANAADQIKLLHQNVSNLYDAIYTPALPTVNRWLGDLVGLTQSASGVAEHHSTAARYAALTLTGLGSGTYYAVQALSSLGAASIFAGQGLKALTYLGSLGSWIGRLGSMAWSAIPGIEALTASFTALQIATGIGAIIALGVGLYELYEHFDWVKKQFVELENWMRGAGLNMMKSLAEGILSGIEHPIRAAESLAHKIGGYFIGHSPPPVGPLHELGRITIAETIAERIRPSPVLSAVARTAAAVAIAAPMMAVPAAGTRTGGAIVHYAPVINGAGLGEEQLLRVLERHAYELRRILDREDERRERTDLS